MMVALPHRTVWCCHDDGVPRKVQKSFAARRMSTKIEVKVITGVICVMVLLPLLDYSAENATQMHELGTWHTAEPMCSCCDMGARAAHHRSAHGVAHADVAMLLPTELDLISGVSDPGARTELIGKYLGHRDNTIFLEVDGVIHHDNRQRLDDLRTTEVTQIFTSTATYVVPRRV